MFIDEMTKKSHLLAKAILEEMSFPIKIKDHIKRQLVDRLEDKIPDRKELSFQLKEGEPAAKEILGAGLTIAEDDEDEEEETRKLFFCIFHEGLEGTENTDIDHLEPVNLIQKKQERLLSFLNTNQAFADLFLKEPGITDYFRVDPRDGKIKGTRYFFKLCYNDIGNLFLMCHGCNIIKNIQNPIEWFKEQKGYFGEKFVKEVEEQGGYHEGVILGRIYHQEEQNITLNISGDNIALPEKPTQSLGKFAREWFFKHFSGVYNTHIDFYIAHYGSFKKELHVWRDAIMQNDFKTAGKIRRNLKKLLINYKAIKEAFHERVKSVLSDDSGSDRSPVAKDREKRLTRAASEIDKIMSELKKIRGLVEKIYEQAEGENCYSFCCELDDKVDDSEKLSSDEWQAIRQKVEKYLGNPGAGGNYLSLQEIQAEIKSLHEKQILAKKDELSRQDRNARIAAEEAAEQERLGREQERLGREAAEEKVAMGEKTIRELQRALAEQREVNEKRHWEESGDSADGRKRDEGDEIAKRRRKPEAVRLWKSEREGGSPEADHGQKAEERVERARK